VLAEWEGAARQAQELGREFRVRRPDGELRWVALRVAPVIGRGDTVTGLVSAVGDITDRREVEAALRESELRATRLQTTAEVGLTVAHELTQPLSILSGYLELLRNRRLRRAEIVRYYAEMDKATTELAEKIRVIQGLRDYITKTYGPGMTVVDLERSAG
jgi:PAS domain-containing protein